MRKLTALFLVCLLLAGLTVVAFADPSPTAKPEFVVDYTSYGSGEAETEMEVITNGDTWTITAGNTDFEFSGFTIQGKYEIVSGSLAGPTLVIRPLEDLVIIANYVGVNVKPGPDDGPISPTTGFDYTLYIIGAVILVALFGAAFATKRITRKEQ